MENKMMMPASYNALNEEEMTYTCGGASDVGTVVAAVAGLAVGALSLYNYVWGLNESRKWLKKNKTGNVFTTASKALDATVDYMGTSVLNTIRGIYTAMQFTSLWPVTAVAWLTV